MCSLLGSQLKRRLSSTQFDDYGSEKKKPKSAQNVAESLIQEFCESISLDMATLKPYERSNVGAFLEKFVRAEITTISSANVEPAMKEFQVQSLNEKQACYLSTTFKKHHFA